MKILILLFSLLFELISYSILLSQPTLEWIKRYPDTTNSFYASSYALALDDSNNAYITGNASSPSSSWNSYCTIKYNSMGNVQWISNFYGPSEGGRVAYAIALDDLKNVYVTGYSYEIGHYFDYCTVKYNSNGIQQWVQYYDGASHGIDQAQKIAVDKAGNIYVTGFSALYTGWSLQNTTIKYSSDGREIWVQRYGNPDGTTYSNGILIDDSCNVYITGANNYSAVTIKYDSAGVQQWVQTYIGNVNGTAANAIASDKFGNIYITGTSKWVGTNEHSDYFTIKYSPSGIQQWLRKYNTDTLNIGSRYNATSINIDNSANVLVSGGFQKDDASGTKVCTIKYSNSGELIWTVKDTVNIVYIPTMEMDVFNNIYVACCSSQSFVTIKYDSTGFLIWKQIYQNVGEPMDIKLDENENIYLTGGGGKMTTIKYSQITEVSKISSKLPESYKLYQNYPNPFNPITKISYELRVTSYVTLSVFDITGKHIIDFINQKQNAGSYEVTFNGTDYSSGIYFYKLTIDLHGLQIFTDAKKTILAK
jgi:hypothetical protein